MFIVFFHHSVLLWTENTFPRVAFCLASGHDVHHQSTAELLFQNNSIILCSRKIRVYLGLIFLSIVNEIKVFAARISSTTGGYVFIDVCLFTRRKMGCTTWDMTEGYPSRVRIGYPAPPLQDRKGNAFPLRQDKGYPSTLLNRTGIPFSLSLCPLPHLSCPFPQPGQG